MIRYTIIVCYGRFFKKTRSHVSKEEGSMDSLCGKNLGFAYGIGTESGSEDSFPQLLLTKEQIMQQRAICKTCLKALK